MSRLFCLGALALLLSSAGCGGGDRVDVQTIYGELCRFGEFHDSENDLDKVHIELQSERDAVSSAFIRAYPDDRCSRADAERLLGVALTDIAQRHKLRAIPFVSDGQGWVIKLNDVE